MRFMRSMALSLNNGRPVWTRDIGSYGGLAMNDTLVIVSDKHGVVHGLSRTDGSGLWKPEGGTCEGAGPEGKLTLHRTAGAEAARCVLRAP